MTELVWHLTASARRFETLAAEFKLIRDGRESANQRKRKGIRPRWMGGLRLDQRVTARDWTPPVTLVK